MSDLGDLLAVYLGAPGTVPGIGAERGRRVRDGLGKYKSPHGSTRYVWYVSGEPVSALQVVSIDGKIATVANVYTARSHRRTGLAGLLLEQARRDFREVRHASDGHLSAEGRAWRNAKP